MRNGGEDGEMCRHSVAHLGKGVRMTLKQIGSRGSKKEPPGSQISTPGGSENRGFNARARVKSVVCGLWRPPGASWAAGAAQEGGLSGKWLLLFFLKGQKSIFGASRVHLGELLAAFGSILGPFPPSGGLREVIFGGFVRVAAREVKNRQKW